MKSLIFILILTILSGSSVSGKPSYMKIDSINEEWLIQIGDIARFALGKYGSNYTSPDFLAQDTWTLLKLEVAASNKPLLARLKNGTALLFLETSQGTVTGRLSVEDLGGDAWIFYFRIIEDRILLEKMVEGSVPQSTHPSP